MSVLKIKNTDGIFEDVLVLRGERGVGVKSIVQEGDHFLFTMTDGSVQTVVSPDCAEILQSAAGASDSAADASASEKNAAASQKVAAASAVNAKGSADSAAASAENAKKSEDEAKAAAEGAAQSVLEKLNYNDETGTVELSDYAKKAYVDAGDTSLKEYLDEPETIYISKSDETHYFTNIKDNWHDEGFEDNIQGDAYVYNDISRINPNIEMTLAKDLDTTVRVTFQSVSHFTGTNTFSIIKNGEAVFTEDKTVVAYEPLSFADYKLSAKAGDVIKFDLNLADAGGCWLYLSEEKNYREYYPADFALEAIRNKVFTLRGDLEPLLPPVGYENFFKKVGPYDGFTCIARGSFSPNEYGNTFCFKIYEWSADKTYYASNVSGSSGDLYLLTYIGGDAWSAINLTGIGNNTPESNITKVFGCSGYYESTDYNDCEYTLKTNRMHFSERECFAFVPSANSLPGGTVWLGSDYGVRIGTVKKCNSAGTLENAQLYKNQPVFLMYDGTQFIVVG